MVALFLPDWFASTMRFVEELFGNAQADPAYGSLQIICRSVMISLAGTIIVRLGKSRMIGRVTLLGFYHGVIAESRDYRTRLFIGDDPGLGHSCGGALVVDMGRLPLAVVRNGLYGPEVSPDPGCPAGSGESAAFPCFRA